MVNLVHIWNCELMIKYLLVTLYMFYVIPLYIISLIAQLAWKSVFPGMFGSVPFQTQRALQHSTAVVAGISSSLVRSHVILVVPFGWETLAAQITEIRVSSCVSLVV